MQIAERRFGMSNIPHKGDYRYQAAVGLTHENKHLRKEIADLRSGEALRKAKERGELAKKV